MRTRVWKSLLLTVVVAVIATIVPAAAAQSSDVVDFRQILTPAYELTSAGLSIPDASLNNVAGAPQLPVKGYSVRMPLNSEWELSYESPGQQLLSQMVTIPAAPVSDLNLNQADNWLNSPDDLPTAVPLLDRPDPAIYAVNAFYPSSPVVVGEPVVQGEERLVPVRVFPFQYNPVTRQLRYHPTLNISVQVRPSSAQPVQPAVVADAPDLAVPAGASGVQLRLHTTQRGIYRLTFEELDDAGVNVGPGGSNPNDFAVFYKGQPVAITVTGAGDDSFDSEDLVLFYAVPYDQGRYQDYNVYYFVESAPASAARIEPRTVTAPFTPTAATTISQTTHVEVNVDYRTLYERPKQADHFFDTQIFANSATPVVTRTYTLALSDPVTATGSIDLSVLIHGGDNNLSFSPDQSVDVKVNSHFVNRYQWEGSVDYLITESLPASWLDESSNTVQLIADRSALPGISAYWISPDWVDLTYPALADAEGDSLYIAGLTNETNDIVATGFSTSAVMVLDVAAPEVPVVLEGVGSQDNAGSYELFWREPAASSSYFLAATGAYLTPSAIEVDAPSNWAASNGFDYIAIIGTERTAVGTTSVGSQLAAAIQPLLVHRTADGFSVAEVGLQDIYDEFSYGFVDPEAIRSFLRHAYDNWPVQPAYVLLVGDGHPSYRSEIDTTLKVLIPPYLVHVDPWIGEVPADSRFVSVNDEDDYLPEMAIGRISANSAADVTAVVNKILAYENPTFTPDGDWQRRSVYVADNCTDPAGNFHALSNDIRQNWLPDDYDSRIVYYDAPPANCPDPSYPTGGDMRTAIKNEFNNGAVFLQWFGHGSTARWGSVSIFNIFDPAALLPSNQMPMVMHNACWTGYFVLWANNWQTLGETLLLTPGKGAIADYSPSGLHIGDALLTLDEGLHKAMFQDRVPRAGDVVNASKYYFFDNSLAYYDLIDSMIFFGDPALKLRLPEGNLATSSFEVSEATAGPDASLVYTATVRNSSIFTTTEPLITVDYPQQWVTVADANGGVDDGDSLSWTLPDLAAGGQNVVTFTLTTNSVLPAGNYNLTVPAEISSNMAPTATLQVTTVTYAEPDLSTSVLAVSRPWIGTGQAITVTALLENTGAADSPGSAMTLMLPAGMTAPIALSPGLTYNSISHTVSWVGDLPVTAAQVLTFTASAESAPITCTALSVSGEVVDVLAASTALSTSVNLAVPDVDCSGAVNVVDIQLVAGRWGATLGQPGYLYQYDLNVNDAIDVNDIIIVANYWH